MIVRSALGSLLHALVAEPGKTEAQMLAELERVWEQLPFDSQWHAANELARHRAMLTAFVEWRAQTRGELTEVGTEIDVDGSSHAGEADRGVRVRGRVDRLERDAEGRLVVVDIKTGKSPVSKDDAQQPRPAGDVSAGGRRRPVCRRATSRAAGGWSTSARPGAAAPPNANRIR